VELTDGTLTGIVLTGTELFGGVLTCVVLTGAELFGGALTGSELAKGVLVGEVLDFTLSKAVLTGVVLVDPMKKSVTIGSVFADCTVLETIFSETYVFSEETEDSDEVLSGSTTSGILGKSGTGILSFSAQPVNMSMLTSSKTAKRILNFFTRSSPV